MTQLRTFEQFSDLILRELSLEVEANSVTECTSLRDDLYFDSLAIFECWIILEEVLGISVQPDLYDSVSTFGELYGWYTTLAPDQSGLVP